MQKKILIVGGSSGLGKELVTQYSDKGWDIAVIARRSELLNEISSRYPLVKVFPADISSTDIEILLAQIIQGMHGIDLCLVTASVIEKHGQTAGNNNMVEVNVSGFYSVVNYFWNYFLERKNGHIAAVTSIAAARGNRHSPVYHASKAFQSVYLESLSVQAKYQGNSIFITELVAGYMDTDMGKGERLYWVSPVAKAARQVIKAIEKKKKRAFITKRWRVVYWISKMMPWALYVRIMNSGVKLKSK